MGFVAVSEKGGEDAAGSPSVVNFAYRDGAKRSGTPLFVRFPTGSTASPTVPYNTSGGASQR